MGVRKPAFSNAAPSPSNPGGSQAQSAAQQSPECRRIAQAHLRGHLFHRKPAAFQHMYSVCRRWGPMASCGRCRSSWTLQAIPVCTPC